MAELFQEVFDIWSRESVQRLEAQRSVLGDAGTAEQLGSAATLRDRDFLGRPLHFRDYGD